MKLPVRKYGDPILRERGRPVAEITDEIRELVNNMIETMDANNGIGAGVDGLCYSGFARWVAPGGVAGHIVVRRVIASGLTVARAARIVETHHRVAPAERPV